MIPHKPLKTVALMPLERCQYLTTYTRDYRPFGQCHLQVNQLKPRTEAKAAPAFIIPPQTHRETWPMIYQYFHETTNNIYGSSSFSQPLSCSLFHPSWRPFGILAPSMCEASGVVGSSLTEARTQEVGATTETGPLLCKEENSQLHYVFGGKANALKQQEAKDEPQQKIDVLYEEGVIELSSRVCPACCEDSRGPVCREAWLQPLLQLPVVKDAESWDNSAYLRGLGPAIGLKNSTSLQPTSKQCSCCASGTACPDSCIPRSSPPPLALVFNCTKPSRKPLLTEYQASYCAGWAWPTMQHHRHLYKAD